MQSIGKFIGAIFLLISLNVQGQELIKVRDVGFWTGAGINYKFNKDWSTSFAQDLRFFDNAQKLDKSITDIGVVYRINNQFKLGGNARYILSRKKDFSFTQDFRYNLDLKIKLKLSKSFDLKYRLRYQNNYVGLFSYQGGQEKRANARNRIELEYTCKKHSFYANAEIFREFVIYQKPAFNSLRFSLGDNLKFKSNQFDYAISYERELDTEHPLNFFYLKFNYTLNYKRND